MEALTTIYKKYANLVAKCFRNDVDFESSVDKAFRSLVNDSSSGYNSSEVLSKLADLLLKKGSKLSQSETEEKLNEITALFKYIDDKDIFQKYYGNSLSKRLIFESYLSEDLEAFMISKLKGVCGNEYTSRLQRMFTDISLSTDINKKFGEFTKLNSIQSNEKLNFR